MYVAYWSTLKQYSLTQSLLFITPAKIMNFLFLLISKNKLCKRKISQHWTWTHNHKIQNFTSQFSSIPLLTELTGPLISWCWFFLPYIVMHMARVLSEFKRHFCPLLFADTSKTNGNFGIMCMPIIVLLGMIGRGYILAKNPS